MYDNAFYVKAFLMLRGDHLLCSKHSILLINHLKLFTLSLCLLEFNCIYLKTYFNVILREVAKWYLPTVGELPIKFTHIDLNYTLWVKEVVLFLLK